MLRIRAIRGANLASLADPFEIDLETEPLKGAGLFAIIGETGAGKSTILDALCLALYGTYPRIEAPSTGDKIEDVPGETIATSDPRSVLRRGAASAYAEADIEVDGEALRARWEVSRKRRKGSSGGLNNAERTLSRLPDGSVIASGKTKVGEEIAARIGLSFDQFRRTVLLAQGDFDAFLRANEAERAELLERITGTELYAGASREVFKRHGSLEQELRSLQERQGAIGLMSPEERAGAESARAAAGVVRQALELPA